MPTLPHALECLPRAFHHAVCALGLSALSAVALAAAPVGSATMAPSALAALGSTHTYTPAVGESLTRIVAKTLPNSPLSPDLLAQAFVSLNPQAFSAGGNGRTLTAAALKVPNHNQLVQLVLAKNEAARPAVLAALSAAEAKAATVVPIRPAEKRENWVRYAGGPVKSPMNFDGSADERKNWVHYLGAAVQRVVSSTTSAEALQWVQYPRAANATTPAATQVSADTRNWVRYTAGRSHPVQQFAQLFD